MLIYNLILKIYYLIIGHITVFKHSLKKRVTLEYPEKKGILSDKFRGKPTWNANSCISCRLCERVCPASAISIVKSDDNLICEFDLKKCIFCGNCMYHCPKSAIKLTNCYELATDNKSDLNLKFTNKNQACENTEVK